jgi:hypothetical protein
MKLALTREVPTKDFSFSSASSTFTCVDYTTFLKAGNFTS